MLNNEERRLDELAIKFSQNMRDGEDNLIVVLIDAEKTKYYRRLDFPDLSKYIQQHLKIEGNFVYMLSQLVKQASKLKCLENALREKRLNRTKASRLLSEINEDNQGQLVEFACTHTYDQIDAFVQGFKCRGKFREKLKKLTDDHHRLTIDLNDEDLDLLKRVQAIEAQAHRGPSLRNATVMSFKLYLQHRCKFEKAKRSQTRPQKDSVAQKSRSSGRMPLTAAQRHAVYLRDQGRCTYLRNGARCNERHITEVHHVIKVCDGGSNEPENLTTLCWHHHDLIHQIEMQFEEASR